MKREPVENSLPGSYHIGDNNPAYIKNSKIKYQVACTYINKWRNKLVFKQRNRSFNKYMKVFKIFSHEGNANQNYIRFCLSPLDNGYHQECQSKQTKKKSVNKVVVKKKFL
jgi:hypothetical protein